MPVAIERSGIDDIRPLPSLPRHIDVGGKGAVDIIVTDYGCRPLLQALGGSDGIVALGIYGVVQLIRLAIPKGDGITIPPTFHIYAFYGGRLFRLLHFEGKGVALVRLELVGGGRGIDIGLLLAPHGGIDQDAIGRLLRHEDALVGGYVLNPLIMPHLDVGSRARCLS